MDRTLCEKQLEIEKVAQALGVISGKWKPTILIYLRYSGVRRFSEIKKSLPPITQKMLTAQLRELERDGLVERKVYAQVPPKVEYALSAYAETLEPVLGALRVWGEQHLDGTTNNPAGQNDPQ
jgi:DNA-binding HxlR family transcriptional regulator